MSDNDEHNTPPDFPAEITFKVICRNLPYISDVLKNVLSEMGVAGEISDRESKKGNFISYTVTGEFVSNDILQKTCSNISLIDGVMMIF